MYLYSHYHATEKSFFESVIQIKMIRTYVEIRTCKKCRGIATNLPPPQFGLSYKETDQKFGKNTTTSHSISYVEPSSSVCSKLSMLR